MDRKNIWRLIRVASCVSILGITSWRMENTKQNLENYWLAKNCPTTSNCRDKIEARILSSKSTDLRFIGGKGISLFETIYTVKVSIRDIDFQEVEILGNPISNGTPFDIPNVITLGSETTLATENFFPERVVYVEYWKNKITLLYLDVLIRPLPERQPSSIGNLQQTLIATAPKSYDIAVPTENHPTFLYSKAESNFYGGVCVVGVIILLEAIALIFPVKNDGKKNRNNKSERP